MKLAIAGFKGEVPRRAAQALPPNAASQTLNGRLLSENVGAWRNFRFEAALCKSPPVVTIYKMTTNWLQWSQSELDPGAEQVDVARSTIAGDTTHRIFFTGTDAPRWTNLALATTGSGCMPRQSRLLGVINPTIDPTTEVTLPTSPVVDATDDGTQYSNWTPVGIISTPTSVRYAVVYEAGGNPAPSYQFVVMNSPTIAWMLRDYGIANATLMLMQTDFYIAALTVPGNASAGLRLACSDGGVGPSVSVQRAAGATTLIIGNAISLDASSTVASAAFATLAPLTWYKLKAQITRNPNGSATCVATVLNDAGDTIIAQLSGQVQVGGSWVMLASANNSAASDGPTSILFDNIIVQASGSLNDPSDDYNTSYVYTFVNDIGEESGPSAPSATIVKDNGTVVTVTTPTSAPTGPDYYVTYKRIYRAVTDASGTTFRFVAEIPLAQADYDDELTNSQLGEALSTEGYELPPEDLRSIIALPNDIYAGVSGNQLCLSAQGAPHAWPVANRYATDDPPVRVGAIDATVVIATEGFPYLASGNDPSVFSMNKLEVPQGCISYRSVGYLKGVGVIYASADGLIAVAGTGQVSVLTEGLYTRKEWQAIDPATIIGCIQDDQYFGFFEVDGEKRGLMIQAKADGYGVVTLGFHATAAFSDTIEDALYLVLDANLVPSITGTTPGGQVNPDGGDIYEFDGYEGGSPTLSPMLPYLWTSKKFLQPYPNCYRYAAVRAVDYDDVWLILWTEGGSYYSLQVTGPDAFVLPDIIGNWFEISIVGTSEVENVQVADDVEEFV